MNTIARLDKQIANYLELLNTKQKKAVLSVVKAFAEEEKEMWEDDSFIKEMNARTYDLETGKVKGYSWDEVKKNTRKSLSELKDK